MACTSRLFLSPSTTDIDPRLARLVQASLPYVLGVEGCPAEGPKAPARLPSSRSASGGHVAVSEDFGGEFPKAPRTPSSPGCRSKKGKASGPHARSLGLPAARRGVARW